MYSFLPRIICIVALIVNFMIISYVIYDEHKKNKVNEINKIKQEDNKVISTDNIVIENEINKPNDTQVIESTKNNPVFNLTDYERWVVECIVMGESGGEPYDGQMLVAQCILNACLKDDITPSEVRKKYKYSGWNENPTNSVKNAVNAVFDLGEKITNEPILYFYAPSLYKSKWHETQIFVVEYGGHRFFKEK